MFRTLIVLPDGTELFSGVDRENTIRNCTITYASNDGDDLMMGSVCSACLEAKVFTATGDFSVAVGDVLTVYKVAEDGTRTQIGVFNAETPTKVTKHIYKITAYDNIRKLDVDMTDWLRGLTGWPYAITTFYSMICEKCGLESHWSSWSGIANFEVHKFDVEKSVTGRQLVSWCAEVMGDYCIANPDGSVQCNWYKTSYIRLYKSDLPGTSPEIEQRYYQGSLSYADFETMDADEVLVREDDSEDSPLWPDVDTVNPYIISGNPIMLNHPDYISGSNLFIWDVLDEIRDRYNFNVYRPFKVTIPELLAAKVGRYAFVQTDNGTILAPITSLVWSGHKMVLECTAKRTRANADSPEYKTNKQLMDYSDRVAQKAAEKAAGEATAELSNLVIYKSCSDCNAAITPGFYYLSGSGCKNHPSGFSSAAYGVMLVEKRNGDIYQTVKYRGYIAVRYSIRDENDINNVSSWKPWEYVNPPMEAGVEYRTTERYQGNTVFTKLVDFGPLPNTTTKTVSCGVAGGNIISWSAVVFTGSGSAFSFPFIAANGSVYAVAYISSAGLITVAALRDTSDATAKFTLKYIKS